MASPIACANQPRDILAAHEIVDPGTTLPNVTDGFAGAAPDLGALEVGMALPHHGTVMRFITGSTLCCF